MVVLGDGCGGDLYYWDITLRNNQHVINYNNSDFGYESLEDAYHEMLWLHYMEKKTYLFFYDRNGSSLMTQDYEGVFKIWKSNSSVIYLDDTLSFQNPNNRMGRINVMRVLGCNDWELSTMNVMRGRVFDHFNLRFYVNMVNRH